MVHQQETGASAPPTVLAAVDFSELSPAVLERTFGLAGGLGAAPHVVTVGSSAGESIRLEKDDDVSLLKYDEAMQYLAVYVQKEVNEFQARYGAARFDVAVCHLRVGNPAREIAQLASDLEAETVIVGTHGRSGVRRLLLGSVAEKVVRFAPCPVFVVRPKQKASQWESMPEIEPPCPRCVETRRQTGGREMWCDQHRHTLGRRHTYSYVSRNSGARENAPLLYPMDRQ